MIIIAPVLVLGFKHYFSTSGKKPVPVKVRSTYRQHQTGSGK